MGPLVGTDLHEEQTKVVKNLKRSAVSSVNDLTEQIHEFRKSEKKRLASLVKQTISTKTCIELWKKQTKRLKEIKLLQSNFQTDLVSAVNAITNHKLSKEETNEISMHHASVESFWDTILGKDTQPPP